MITVTGRIAKVEDIKSQKTGSTFRSVRIIDKDENVHKLMVFDNTLPLIKGSEITGILKEDVNGVLESFTVTKK